MILWSLALLCAVLALWWALYQGRWRRPVRHLWWPALVCLAAALFPPVLPRTWWPFSGADDAPIFSDTDLNRAAWATQIGAPAVADAGLSSVQWASLPARAFAWTAPPLRTPSAPSRVQLGDPWVIDVPVSPDAHTLQLRSRSGSIWATQELAPPETAVASPQDAAADTAVQRVSHLTQLAVVPRREGAFAVQLEQIASDGRVLRRDALFTQVQAVAALQVQGDFSAPSFEQRALREWLQASGSNWQFRAQTGAELQREDASTPTPAKTQLRVLDARRWLRASAQEQQLWRDAVAAGEGLLLLADGSENDAAAREQLTAAFGMSWRSDDPQWSIRSREGNLRLTQASWSAGAASTETAGTAAGTRGELDEHAFVARLRSELWSAALGKGRVLWWPLWDAHRLWQRQPALYAAALQAGFERVLPARSADLLYAPDRHGWRDRAALICAREPVQRLWARDEQDREQALAAPQWWPAEQAWCTLFWPRATGVLRVQAENAGARREFTLHWPVLDSATGPTARDADQRSATQRAQLQFGRADADTAVRLPAWPFALMFVLLSCVIWWCERRWPDR